MRLQKIFKEWVTPVLHADGFKMERRIYVRELGKMCHVLNTESDDLNTSEKYSFTLNCGVIIPDVMRIWWNREELPTLDASCGVLNVRPGHLRAGGDQWWYLHATDGPDVDAEIGRDVRSVVEMGAIPFFERFPNEHAVAEFLSRLPREMRDNLFYTVGEAYQMAYAAILWKTLGDRKRCRACIDHAIALSRKTPGRAVVDKFVARFSCDG